MFQPGNKLGGRPKGRPNKATAEIRELAAKYGPDALAELARLSREAESERARVAACKEILDRAYGKSLQSVDLTGNVSVAHVVEVPPLARSADEWLTQYSHPSPGAHSTALSKPC